MKNFLVKLIKYGPIHKYTYLSLARHGPNIYPLYWYRFVASLNKRNSHKNMHKEYLVQK